MSTASNLRIEPLPAAYFTLEQTSPNFKQFQCLLLGLHCTRELANQLLTDFYICCTLTFFQPQNTLPQSYKEVQKSLWNVLSPTEEYPCCINDFVIFRDSDSAEYAQLNRCPKCNEPCYKRGSDSIPHKHFIHLPLEGQLRRIFARVQQHSSFSSIVPLKKMPRDHRMLFLPFMKQALGSSDTVAVEFIKVIKELHHSVYALTESTHLLRRLAIVCGPLCYSHSTFLRM